MRTYAHKFFLPLEHCADAITCRVFWKVEISRNFFFFCLFDYKVVIILNSLTSQVPTGSVAKKAALYVYDNNCWLNKNPKSKDFNGNERKLQDSRALWSRMNLSLEDKFKVSIFIADQQLKKIFHEPVNEWNKLIERHYYFWDKLLLCTMGCASKKWHLTLKDEL